MSYNEYAAFGPWVDEVASVEQVPRLFRDYPIDFATSLLVVKVPRDISRRDADPSMDLFDALVVVTAEHLTVLHRTEGAYTIQRTAHGSIFALENSVSLLDGQLTLHSVGRAPVQLSYNGSGRHEVDRLVNLLRSLNTRGDAAGVDVPTLHPAQVAVEDILISKRDYGIRGDSKRILREESDAVVLGGHATTSITPIGRWKSITHAFRPAVFQGAVVLARHTEISIVHRRSWVARASQEDLSSARTFVFPTRVQTTSILPHQHYRELAILRIAAGNTGLDLVVPAASPTKDLLLTVSTAA